MSDIQSISYGRFSKFVATNGLRIAGDPSCVSEFIAEKQMEKKIKSYITPNLAIHIANYLNLSLEKVLNNQKTIEIRISDIIDRLRGKNLFYLQEIEEILEKSGIIEVLKVLSKDKILPKNMIDNLQ